VTIIKGESAVCAWNGSDFIKISNTAGSGVFSSITNTGLTSGRVVYSTTGGLETDSANLTFNGTTLTANTLNLTNALGTTYGGTGLTSYTANGVVYASSSSALATGSALTFDGTNLATTGAVTGTQLVVSGPQLVDGQVRLYNTTTRASGNKYGIRFADSSFETNASIYAEQSGSSNNAAALVFGVNAGTGGISLTSAPEQMRLTSTGLIVGSTSYATTGVSSGVLAATAAVIGSQSGDSLYIRRNGTAGEYAFQTTISGTSNGNLVLQPYGGNLGLGVTPSAWNASYKALQLVGGWAALSSNDGFGTAHLSSNCYATSTSAWAYVSASSYRATRYQMGIDGIHAWFNSAAGTAGNAITFTQAMTLDASGNLGIGTTSPAQKLHLSNSASNTYVRMNANTHDGYIGQQTDGEFRLVTAASSSFMTFHTVGTERARIDSSGNFGIGTTSPQQKLVVSNGGALGFEFVPASGIMQTYNRSTGAYNNMRFDASELYFYTGTSPTERARIDSSGNLLIGDTTAAAKLWVYKTDTGNLLGGRATNASYSSTVEFLGADRNTTNNSFYYLDCYNYGSSTYRLRIADSGNVTNTNNSYGAISDAKLKENIVDATPKLAGLMQVKVRNYNLIGDTTKQLGVVAQELETVFPAMIDETVDRDAEGNDLGTTTKQVKYSVFVPMLIKAIQEMKSIIDDQAARIATLEAK
jgi:hypothetical protein